MLKIAIIIPCYNSAQTIGETLGSLIEQLKSPNIHAVFIADDCSSDDTLKICQSYADREQKITIVPSPQNQGERRNINRILPHLLTEQIDWFLILHSDDLAKASWFQENLDCIQQATDKTASICSSWDDWYPQENRIQAGENKIDTPYVIIEGNRDSIIGTFQKGCWWHVSGCAIRVSAFASIGGFAPDLPQLGDFDWLLRALSKGWTIEYIPRSLILYRQHPLSVSSNSFRNDRDTREFLGILEDYLNYLNFSTFSTLWKNKLRTSVRRLARSLVLRDFALIKRRIQTLWLLNLRFITLAIRKIFS